MNCRLNSTPPLRKWGWLKSGLLASAMALLGTATWAQSPNSYVFATGTTGANATLTTMTGSTQLVGTGSDDGAGALTNIGFNFTFNSVVYTQFSANVNGCVRLGALTSTASTYYTNSLANANTGTPLIMPYWDDLATGTNGKVHYLLLNSGAFTAPNRRLVIEWIVTVPRNTTGAAGATFQCWLDETTNAITYVYGAGMAANSTNSGYTIGINAATSQFSNVDATTHTNNVASFLTTTSVAIASPRWYSYTPPPQCSGQPSAAVIPNNTGACSGLTATITASSFQTGLGGITFQWEESPDGVNSWANVVGGSGATTTSYTTTAVTTTRYFRLKTTCAAVPGSPSYSNVCTVGLANCQFTVARNTGISYSSIAGTGTNYSGWTSTTNTDDATTGAVSLTGTTFTYQGAAVSGFKACTNGWMTFQTSSTATSYINNLGTTTSADWVKLAPFWDDLVCTGNTSTNAGQNASMKYQIIGTLGSGTAKIIAEWIGMETYQNAGPNLNFQVVLDENGNTITYNYGTMEGFNGTNDYAYSYSIGMNGSSVAASPTSYTEVMALRDENTTNFTFSNSSTANSGNNNQVYLPACNSQYVFTPAGAYPGPGAAPTITPSNDEPGTAINLPVNASPCTSFCGTYYRNQGATASAGITACSVAGTTPDDDVWFTFTATTSSQTITVRGAGGMNPVVQLFSDAGITPLYCLNGTGQGLTEVVNATGLTPSALYYVRVYHSGAGQTGTPVFTYNAGSPVTGAAAFSICVNEVVPPPTNDDICGATSLSVNATCVTTAGSTITATASSQAAPSCGTADDDVWYKFTAATTADLVTVQSGAGFNAAVNIYSSSDNTCSGTLTSLNCVNNTSTAGAETYSGPWTAGNTYFIRVFHNTSGAGTGNFTICVTATAPPCATLSSPANAASVYTNPVALSWSSASGATGYDVYADQNVTPTTLVSSNQAGTSFNYTPTTPSAGQVYYWTVVPRNGVGAAAGPCTVRSFTLAAPACPTLVSPVANYSSEPPTETLTWNASTGATDYILYYDITTPPASLGSTGGATSVPVGEGANRPYYWQVDAVGPYGTSSGCEIRYFHTFAPDCIASPTSPSNGASITSCTGAVTLTWPTVPGDNVVYTVVLDGNTVSTNQAGTTYGATGLASGPHSWSVTPSNANGPCASPNTWTFTTTGAPATGETFGNPTPLGTITTPYTGTGDNICRTDDWTTTSTPGNAGARPGNDVFYSFTTGPCVTSLNVGVCPNSSGDSYLWVLNGAGTVIASDDDTEPVGCAATAGSRVTGVTVTPNTQYYLVIEDYYAATDVSWTLTMSTNYVDTDADGTADCNDGCPTDANKIAPGQCGCGVADTDTDNDGTANCVDGCPNDPNKIAPGICGCGVSDTDTDSDGTADCNDGCPNDPNKIAPGICGCGTPDTDSDGDGIANCNDNCPNLVGQQGDACDDGNACTTGDVINGSCVCVGTGQDADNDGICDANDNCPNLFGQQGDACNDGNVCTINDVITNACVCAGTFQDSDNDGTCDANDGCPNDANKIAPGQCGCGVADTDTDSDGTADCNDGCPNDANKIAPGICGCGVADTDSDNDGTANCNDGCPNDPNKIAPGQCGCGVADTDSDNDGTANCNDACPNDPNKIAPGACGCGVADTDSDNDGTPNCFDGCPNDPNKIVPGACGCGVADTDSDNDGTPNCNDGCPTDPNKIAPGACGCGVADTDSDNDGTPNCLDNCPNLAGQQGDACNDGNACTTNDVITNACVCAGTFADADGDGICDANDNCPNLFGQQGDACNDGNPNTINDVITAGCVCAGTPVSCPFNEVTLVLNTDANASQTSWDIVNGGTTTIVCSGSGYANNSTITVQCCLPNGCYDLRVHDSFGDGINPGGFLLKDASNRAIVDNVNNGQNFTSLSMVRDASNVAQSFCVPLSNDGIGSGCGNEAATSTTVIQAVINPTVSAAYSASNSTTGYQFWFFNPNGGYSRKVFQSHAAPGSAYPGAAPAAERCSYFKLSSIVSNPLPTFTLLNVRVRTQVNGVYGAYGPACRIKIDPLAGCQPTQLTTVGMPVNPAASCGATVNRNGGIIYANVVSGANKYQFQFTRPGYTRNIASNTRSLTLANWATNPLQCGLTYDVKVRVSFDNGATYCPYGVVCQITTTCSPSFGGTDNRDLEAEPVVEMQPLQVWPNPNDGDQIYLSQEGIDPTIEIATVDITDLFGRRVYTHTLNVNDGRLNEQLELNNTLANGVYVLTLTTGEHVSTERIVIQ